MHSYVRKRNIHDQSHESSYSHSPNVVNSTRYKYTFGKNNQIYNKVVSGYGQGRVYDKKKKWKPKYVIETGNNISLIKNKHRSITARSNFIKEQLRSNNNKMRDLSDPSRRNKNYFEINSSEKINARFEKHKIGTCLSLIFWLGLRIIKLISIFNWYFTFY